MEFLKTVCQPYLAVGEQSLNFSALCIATTNPVYLIFRSGATVPDFVLKILDDDDAEQAWLVHQQLYELAPQLISEPLGIREHKGLRFSVERGAKGAPWFQIGKAYSTRDAWLQLCWQTIDALDTFQIAVSRQEQWQKYHAPASLLKEAFAAFQQTGTSYPPLLESYVTSMCAKLAELGTIRCWSQHGDFCLNNLLIAEHGLTVIDFEDFGLTDTPFYDEFTLALSLGSREPNRLQPAMAKVISLCTLSGLKRYNVTAEYLPALFLLHLLLKLGAWSLPAKRRPHRAWLMALLLDFINQPTAFIVNDHHE